MSTHGCGEMSGGLRIPLGNAHGLQLRLRWQCPCGRLVSSSGELHHQTQTPNRSRLGVFTSRSREHVRSMRLLHVRRQNRGRGTGAVRPLSSSCSLEVSSSFSAKAQCTSPCARMGFLSSPAGLEPQSIRPQRRSGAHAPAPQEPLRAPNAPCGEIRTKATLASNLPR